MVPALHGQRPATILRLIDVPRSLRGVIFFDDRAAFKCAQDFVAADDDLVTLFDPPEDLDVGRARDPSSDRDEGRPAPLLVSPVRLEQIAPLPGGCLRPRERLCRRTASPPLPRLLTQSPP